MKKSGLADSPFFAPLSTSKPTPLPPDEPKKETADTDTENTTLSPTQVKEAPTLPHPQMGENQDQKRSFERSNERTMERTNVRPPKQERVKIRHTFDVYKDQLIALQEIQIEKVRAGKKKPKLGKMVSDGIDLYLKQWTSKKKQG